MKTIKSSNRRVLICLVIWFVSGIPAGASQPSEKNLQTVILQLKWLHQFQFAGYYTAIEKRYYQDAGLNVIIKEGKPGLNFADEVISKHADYGIDMPVLLLDRNEGKPVVVLAAIFQHSPEALIARKDSGITSPHDMIGKRILMRPHGHAENRAMLRREGTSEDQLKIIDHSWDINDLIERKVDVSGAYITDFPFLMQERGIPYSLIRPITYGIDFYGDCIFTSEEKTKKQPDQVKAFLEASLKGWNYAMSHKEEIVELILQKYSSRLSKAALLFEAEAMQELIFPDLIEMGHMNPGRWKHIGDTFVKLGMLEPDYSLDGFLYNPNPPSNYEKIKKITKILVGVLAIISISSVLLVWYNRKLNREVIKRTEHLTIEIENRQKAELLLKESQSRLETILETLPIGVWYTDSKGKIIYGNPAGQNIWQGARFVEPKQFHEYKAWWRKTGKLISSEEWAVSRAIKKQEVSAEEELEIECFDGTHKIILNWASPFLDDNGDVLGVVVVNQDITKQKEAEQEREQLIEGLKQSFNEIKLLRDILPICAICKNIRNDEGYYEQIENYFHKNSGVDFSHTICPECLKERYPEEYEIIVSEEKKKDQASLPKDPNKDDGW